MNRPELHCSRRQFLRYTGRSVAALALMPALTVPALGVQAPESELDMKIGQMIMAGFRGFDLKDNNPIVEDLRERYVGSTVLFDYDVGLRKYKRNIESPEQLAQLDQDLLDATPKTVRPLLISIDQEGGIINRLKPAYGFPPSYSQQYLGTKNDLKFTYQCGLTTAQTLSDMHINLNLAPVVDLNINPQNAIIGKYERSFSADPEIVTAHALKVIDAHHDLGILTTLKHFPGHGSSAGDSHVGFVDVTHTWDKIELEPFRNIICWGEADAVMTAHIFNAKLDPTYPATLSKLTITGILRDELGWDGVVITDDMGMGAIADNYGFEDAVMLAIEAGIDILAFANNSSPFKHTIPARAFEVVRDGVRSGAISEARIDKSYQRILTLKKRLPRHLERQGC